MLGLRAGSGSDTRRGVRLRGVFPRRPVPHRPHSRPSPSRASAHARGLPALDRALGAKVSCQSGAPKRHLRKENLEIGSFMGTRLSFNL